MPEPVGSGQGTDGAVRGTGTDAGGRLLDADVTRPRPGCAVLTVQGEIDTLTAPAFTHAVTELVDAPDETLVVDLTGVRFLASSGLAVLITAAQRVEERGTRLRLVVSTRAVRRPLEITGTEQLFDLHSDMESALDMAIGGSD